MRASDEIRAFVGRRLEQGVPASWPARIAATVWGAWSARAVARPLELPAGARVIGIGGAVLGGAGKTPVAIALVRALVARGERAVFVGHAYRAAPGRPRIVRPTDAVADVGDDALAAARVLDRVAPVVVAPTRQQAIELAAGLGKGGWIVVDGLLQAAPRRLALAVLVVDAARPWGAGACPPLGDLRAPRDALTAAADVIAAVRAQGTVAAAEVPDDAIDVPSHVAGAVSASGESVPTDALRRARVGLLVAVARPERVTAALARMALAPAATLALGDHAVPTPALLRRAARAGVDLWLTTARCATKLPASLAGAPILALDHRVDVTDLVARIATRAGD